LPPGTREAGHDPAADRVPRRHHDHRNAARRLPGGQGAGIRADHDDVDAILDQRRREPGQLVGLALGEPRDEHEASALDPPQLLKALPKRVHEWSIGLGREGRQPADSGRPRRRLRARAERSGEERGGADQHVATLQD